MFDWTLLVPFGIVILWSISIMEQCFRTFDEKESSNEKIPSTVHSNNPKILDGTFEIHITIHPNNDYTKLLKYIYDKRTERKFKLVFAVSGTNNQYMLSYFTRKDNDEAAVNSARQVAANLELNDISVSRVKVECHDVRGIPMTDQDYTDMNRYLNLKYNNECNKPYFEFHCKIDPNGGDLDDLEKDVNQYKQCAVSYNLCSSNKNPILTIRVYDVGFVNAEKFKNEVMNSLKKLGYLFEDKIQKEFSIFDSNLQLDAGFLMKQNAQG